MFRGFLRVSVMASAAMLGGFVPCLASEPAVLTQNVVRSYADLADWSESAPLILVAEVQAVIPLDRAALKPSAGGKQRFYIEARAMEVLRGVAPAGQELRYLADIAIDTKGRAALGKKQKVVLFSRPVAGGNGEIQLVNADAQLVWEGALEARLRPLVQEVLSPAAAPRVTGVSMALYQAGDLVGEGETQIFLNTANGVPAAIIVTHKAGQPARWTASFSEVVDPAGNAPAKETLAWYRLACFLPPMLPAAANVGDSQDSRDHALGDYLLVMRDLGPCGRSGAGH